MKNRVGMLLLAVICVGLAVAVFIIQKQAGERKKADAETITALSNQWETATSKLEDTKQVAATLENDLKAQRASYADLTNTFTGVTTALSNTSTALAKTEENLSQIREESSKKDAKIADLESQNQLLDRRALELSEALTNLTSQITETRRKLAAAEGDKAFLQKELKQLLAEKSELERQFNDVRVLKTQIAKLKQEMNIARRIEWIRKGLYASGEQKGATRLLTGTRPPTTTKPTRPPFDLNVEVSSDGSVRVIPPSTNAPPATNSSPAK